MHSQKKYKLVKSILGKEFPVIAWFLCDVLLVPERDGSSSNYSYTVFVLSVPSGTNWLLSLSVPCLELGGEPTLAAWGLARPDLLDGDVDFVLVVRSLRRLSARSARSCSIFTLSAYWRVLSVIRCSNLPTKSTMTIIRRTQLMTIARSWQFGKSRRRKGGWLFFHNCHHWRYKG